jgi:four helix bundle protein
MRRRFCTIIFYLFSIIFYLKNKLGGIMAQDSILLDKSLKFAARIIKLQKYLVKEQRESVISKQIIRSATSIGANANEAIYGISKADFIAKLQISLKETAETEYWLRLLILSDYVSEELGKSLLGDCLEIKRILISTLNTAKATN